MSVSVFSGIIYLVTNSKFILLKLSLSLPLPFSFFSGIGWVGCSQEYEYPSGFNEDYGDAIGICSETSPGSGIFTREFTKSTVQMNCSSYVPTIAWK